MKKYIFIITICSILFIIGSCSDSFLDRNPRGAVFEEQLCNAENAEKMVIAAYAAGANEFFLDRSLSPWPYGDLRSGDAYKGGAGPGDNLIWHMAEIFIHSDGSNSGENGKWFAEFVAITKINIALSILHQVPDEEMPTKADRIAEMRFLRANHYFWLKVHFDKVPYIDESIPLDEHDQIGNDMPDQELWGKIIDDFRYAAQNLPIVPDDGAVGRATKYAAKAYLAKALLFAAYEKNEKHEVTTINQEKLKEVVSLCQEVLNNTGKDLFADFGDNFECHTQNGIESIWAIQFSHEDGTQYGRINGTTMVCYPMVQEYGCCGYHSPSQNLVNAFRTVNGLPDFDNFNNIDLINAESVKQHTIDPRLLHTVAMDGLPYKYKPDFIFNGLTWTRQPETYGQYLSMKETVIYDCECYQEVNAWKDSSKNRDVIRIADVMLWLSEALIQLGKHDEALPYINRIRERAAQSTGKLVDVDGNPTGNFDIRPYIPAGADKNCDWNRDFAFKALQWERRLEFACEGFRSFDLMRWGIMAEVVNEYLEKEKTRRTHLMEAKFTKGRDEFLAIPKPQMLLSKGLYVQNPGY